MYKPPRSISALEPPPELHILTLYNIPHIYMPQKQVTFFTGHLPEEGF